MGNTKEVPNKYRNGRLFDHAIKIGAEHSGPFDRKTFAEKIGAQPDSNGPGDKLRESVTIGIYNKDRHGSYVLSELGKKVIRDDIPLNEKVEAKIQVTKNTPMFGKIFNIIGVSGKKNEFISEVKKLFNIHDESELDKLWNKYNDDVSCVDKVPPYSKESPNLGKSRNRQQKIATPNIVEQQHNEKIATKASITTAQKNNSISNLPFDLTDAKLLLEFHGKTYEVKDALSIVIAKGMLRLKESKTTQGDEYG
jgi:hypothetical protein